MCTYYISAGEWFIREMIDLENSKQQRGFCITMLGTIQKGFPASTKLARANKRSLSVTADYP